MAVEYSVTFEAAGADRALRLYPAQTQRATVRALNRALTTGHAALARLVSQDMGLTVGAVKKAITTTKAHAGNLSIRLAASRRPLPLILFKSRQTGKGVTYQIGKGVRGRIPMGFIARAKGPLPSGIVSTGHLGVFVRQGKKRLPITQRFGPSLGSVFSKQRDAGVAAMRESFAKNLAHELKFAKSEDA